MNQDSNHHKYMSRAMELARLGKGEVSPNPMVGCVIVHNDKIIGEGYHIKYGGPHAEVNAINSVKQSHLLPESNVYVTLEPCAHYGKTPPCASLLVEKQVKKVIIANMDPNPLVSGKGVRILKDAGIEVENGVLEEEGNELNKRFFKHFLDKRPYIILKWAETADGFIARENYDSKWISNQWSRILVHKWRAEEDAILVGKNTALYDNPTLNVRDWTGTDPLRVVIDHQLKLKDENLNLLTDKKPTICYNLLKEEVKDTISYVKCDDGTFVKDLLTDLYQKKILSLIVEGGKTTLKMFIDSGQWDEARVFKSKNCFGKGISSPQLTNAVCIDKEDILGDELYYFKNEKNG